MAALILGFVLAGFGALLILAARDPGAKPLSRALFDLTTWAPRAGTISDRAWVLVNGIGLVLAGVVAILFSLLS